LKGLYFEKIKDKNNMFGFSLYHDHENFRKRRLFHKDENVINTWIRKLKHHCSFYSVNEFYSQTARLGGGKFSEVFEAKHKKTNMAYALKKIDKTKLNAREKEFLRDEIQIISLLSHPNTVEIREVYETKRWMFIMMEQV
jgi:serine/threonine protein kinase